MQLCIIECLLIRYLACWSTDIGWNLADFSKGVNEMSHYGLQLLGISDQDFVYWF